MIATALMYAAYQGTARASCLFDTISSQMKGWAKMEKKQELIAKMLELQHLFEKQSDASSQAIVASIKQAIDKVADKRIQGVNIAPQVLPIGYFIRDEMRDHQYQLTLAQRTVLFDMEGMAEAIANKYFSGIPSF